MDSLLASYASSDEEVEEKESKPSSSSSSSLSKPSLFSSLPPPKITVSSSSSSSSSSSLFSSLPAPKSHPIEEIRPIESNQKRPIFASLPPPRNPSSSSSNESEENRFEEKQKRPIFSSLPPPKSQPASNPNPNPKRVVQFTLPLNPSLLKPNGIDDEDDDEEERKPGKDSSDWAAVAEGGPKGLSSMLPAPKNSLGFAPTAASRRSAFDSKLSATSKVEVLETRQESSTFDSYGSSKAESFEGEEQQQLHQENGNFEDYGSYPLEQGVSGYENYGSYEGDWSANGLVDSDNASSYQSGGYENYGSYGGFTSEGNAGSVPEMERIMGKRRRNEIPTEIVEVNQAELMKNRPREDQVKATGIAFGPAYQAVSSSKGKPSKLHKRKHQIGSLFFDMKQKEMELAERRAKGFLTKAETHAKYGW